jgi:hypothetical protein
MSEVFVDALWWVTKGRAEAPDTASRGIGVSISVKPS